MVLTGTTRSAGLRQIARMLSLKLRLRRPACHFDCSLPLPHHKAVSWSPRIYPAAAPVRNRLLSTSLCRPASSQPTNYSVLSYSSAQPHSPQQLAELREDARDTIVALSSGSGRAGVAVIRISGPRAGKASSYGTCLSCCHRHFTTVSLTCSAVGVQMMCCRRC